MAGMELVPRSTLRNLAGSKYVEVSLNEEHWFSAAFDQYKADLQKRFEDSLRIDLTADPVEQSRMPAVMAATMLEIELARTFIAQSGYVNFNDFQNDAIGGHYNLQHFIWARTNFIGGLGLAPQVLTK